MNIIRNGLAGLTILLASKLPLVAQDAPQQPPAKTEQATENQPVSDALPQRYGRIFQFVQPDAAFPGANTEGQFIYGTGFKDIDGSILQPRLRTVFGDFKFTGNIYELDGERDERTEEFLPVFNPGENNVITTLDSYELKHSLWSGSIGYGPAELLIAKEAFEENFRTLNDDLFTDPVTVFQLTTNLSQEFKRESTAYGGRADLGKWQIGAFGWNARQKMRGSRVEDVFLQDTFDPMNPINFTSRNEILTLEELVRSGGIVSVAHETDWLPTHPLIIGIDLGIERLKRKLTQSTVYSENGTVLTSTSSRDEDKYNAYRIRLSGDWGPVRIAPGYLSKNLEGDGQLTLDANIILHLSENFAPILGGGINDLGKAYGNIGLAFMPQQAKDPLRAYNNHWVDRQIAPIGDQRMAFYEQTHGLAHQGAAFGAFITKDANDETVVMPYAVFGNKNIAVSLAGEINDDIFRGQAMGTLRIYGPIKLIAGARGTFRKAEDTEFTSRDERTELEGFAGIGGEITR